MRAESDKDVSLSFHQETTKATEATAVPKAEA